MTYLQLAYLHLATILPAFFLGTYLLLNRKGTKRHKLLGKLYMGLMLFTALVTLFMPAQVGNNLFNHFGFIHIFSFLVLYSVPSAYLSAKKGNITAHKLNMIQLYIGGILIAGAFTFSPGRMLYGWFF
jgi:uncharacterized membrane protein